MRIILFLLILCLCGLVGYAVNLIPLRVIFKADTYYIETSLIVWLLLSLVASVALYHILKALCWLWHSPQIFSRNSAVRRQHKADRLLKSGMTALLAGHYSRAERDLDRGGKLAESLGQNAVIYFENAAIAADRQNAKERRDHYLLLARQDARHQHGSLPRLAEAEIHVQNGAYEQAAKLLEKLHQEEPRNSKITALLDETYAKQQDWAKAWALLPALRPHLAEAEYSTRQKTYAKGLLHDTATRESVEALEAAWKRLPAEVRRDKDMILQYAGALVENDHPEEAEKLLAAEIRQTQDLEYIQAYSQLRRANFRAQLEHMKQWENKHTNDAIFLYAKALIAYKAKELDIALAAIEEAVKRSQTQEAFALYAQILEAKNRPEAALVAYRQSVAPLHPEQALDGDLLPAPEAEAPKPDDSKTS
ncbi:heme biosynthesis HemY N-terminal domain-containing protein [Cardiobacterium hominis]